MNEMQIEWLKRLRSGDYAQIRGTLRDNGHSFAIAANELEKSFKET